MLIEGSNMTSVVSKWHSPYIVPRGTRQHVLLHEQICKSRTLATTETIDK